MIGKEIIVNGISYYVVKLLGHGKGGYSYLVKSSGKEYVLKQIHHEPCSYYTFGNKIESELNDYQKLLATGITIPKMIDIDLKQEIIIKEYIEGVTIFDLVKDDKMKNEHLEQGEKIAELAYSFGLNIDYYPTNFIVNKDDKLYYIDYECNNYMEEWNFNNWGIKYWSKTKDFVEALNKTKSI